MEKWDARTLLLALHEMEGVGWATILRLLSRFEDLTVVQHLEAAELERLGIRSAAAATIASRLADSDWIEQRLDAYERSGTRLIAIMDADYPYLLKQTAQPPWVLYARGWPELLRRPLVAVVGTRTPTAYGKAVAASLSRAFAAVGLCVVSGLARGVDSEAHRGAMREAGGTVAVLGCGIDVVYPPDNAALYRDIAAGGLIVSEYPLGTRAHAGLFPQRNRIIAGLCPATLVVEGAAGSGSLITARYAVDEGRDVYAVPGPITSPKSSGALKLVKDGEAAIVTGAADIIDAYKPRAATHNTKADRRAGSEAAHGEDTSRQPQQLAFAIDESAPEMTPEEEAVHALLSVEPTTIDELLVRSRTNFGHLHAILLSLILKKRIAQLPGSSYVVI